MTSDSPDAPDAVQRVLESWRIDREAVLLRRFEHGVGGTSLISLEGEPCVLKAWRKEPGDSEARLDQALELAGIMGERGVGVPALRERGVLGGDGYLVYEQLRGDWSDQLGVEAVEDLLQILDAARDAAPRSNPTWHQELRDMLESGDPSFDIAPQALQRSAAGRRVLRAAQERLAACDADRLRTGDIVHGDFAPENVLVLDGRVVGVVDWERARVGDSGLDLVGALVDIEIGEKTTGEQRERLWSEASARMPDEVLSAYVGVYAVRYLSWALGTEMETEVLELADRLLARTAWNGGITRRGWGAPRG